MDSTSIELPGSTVSGIRVEGDTIRVEFQPAYLVKSMTGSVERTRWWQNGALIFETVNHPSSRRSAVGVM